MTLDKITDAIKNLSDDDYKALVSLLPFLRVPSKTETKKKRRMNVLELTRKEQADTLEQMEKEFWNWKEKNPSEKGRSPKQSIEHFDLAIDEQSKKERNKKGPKKKPFKQMEAELEGFTGKITNPDENKRITVLSTNVNVTLETFWQEDDLYIVTWFNGHCDSRDVRRYATRQKGSPPFLRPFYSEEYLKERERALTRFFCSQLGVAFEEAMYRTVENGLHYDLVSEEEFDRIMGEKHPDMSHIFGIYTTPGRRKGKSTFGNTGKFKTALWWAFSQRDEKLTETGLIEILRDHPFCNTNIGFKKSDADNRRTLQNWLEKAGFENHHDAWRQYLLSLKNGK